MELVIDMRERGIMDGLRAKQVAFRSENLTLGDMAIRNSAGEDVILFERKTYSDLLASIKDGRYQEQSIRLLNTGELHSHNIVYVIEKDSVANESMLNTVRSAIVTLQYFKGFSVMRTTSVKETVELLSSYVDKLTRELKNGKKQPAFVGKTQSAANASDDFNYCSVVQKVKRDNITPQNITEIVLCQIPGVGKSAAVAVARLYPTFTCLIDALREKRVSALSDVRMMDTGVAGRRISTTAMKAIVTFLTTVGPEETLDPPPKKRAAKRKKAAEEPCGESPDAPEKKQKQKPKRASRRKTKHCDAVIAETSEPDKEFECA